MQWIYKNLIFTLYADQAQKKIPRKKIISRESCLSISVSFLQSEQSAILQIHIRAMMADVHISRSDDLSGVDEFFDAVRAPAGDS